MSETWAIVELMGHVKLAGKLSEEERFGVKMGRLDIPAKVDCPILAGAIHAVDPAGTGPLNPTWVASTASYR